MSLHSEHGEEKVILYYYNLQLYTYMVMEMVIENRFHFLTFPYYLWGELEIQQIGLLDLQFQNLHMFNILECIQNSIFLQYNCGCSKSIYYFATLLVDALALP